MRAVNQAIGRAIRHKSDFSAIALVDARFEEQTALCDDLPFIYEVYFYIILHPRFSYGFLICFCK
jgi:Rad3-related DNA helicase